MCEVCVCVTYVILPGTQETQTMTQSLYICSFLLFQGEVHIIEGEPDSDSIRVDIDKSGPTVPSLEYIVAHQALYDVGKGMVYVVQVVSTKTEY